MEALIEKSIRKVQQTSTQFNRYLMTKINWQRRLIGIKGARGTGKTTLMLQYIKQYLNANAKALYVSLDDLFFTQNSLVSLADRFVKLGGEYLLLDEVHKYPHWSREIKNLYDDYPHLHVVFTGSSILEIDRAEADLSRRAMLYHLPAMSLREYALFRHQIVLPCLSLNDILTQHTLLANEITQRLRPLPLLYEYYRTGVYPFAIEADSDYAQHLLRIVSLIIETDVPAVLNVDYQTVHNLKKLLYVLAGSVPFKPNISEMSRSLHITRDTLVRYLNYLQRTRLIMLLQSHKQGMSLLAKPEKIYLENPNLVYAINHQNANVGNVRETFFFNQLQNQYSVTMPPKGDFEIDNEWIFEIGGQNKKYTQIADIPNSFVASDDIEIGFGNRIPLWMFGLLY